MNERDPDLERLYRERSREEPPTALDAKILAAAHRAVASAPRTADAQATRPQRWWMPLAAAAAIGVVAIGIVQQAPKETAIDATSVATAPAPAPSSPPVVAPPPAAAPAPAPSSAPVAAQPSAPAPAPGQAPAARAEMQAAPSSDIGALAKKQKAVEAPVSPPPARASAPKPVAPEKLAESRENKVVAEPTPFPAATSPQKTEVAAAKRDAPMEQSLADARKDATRDERPSAAGAVAQAPAAAPPPPAAPASVARMRSQSDSASNLAQPRTTASEFKNEEDMRTLARDPDAWIVRIRKLRDDGNVAQAQRELKEFRTLVPDAERRLPQDLRSLQP